jgi:hypothetical protein
MSSTTSFKHTVTEVAPTGASVGDEYFNPVTNELFKRIVYNGNTVQWIKIGGISNDGGLLFKSNSGVFSSGVVKATNGIVVNSQTIASSYTIEPGYSAMSSGPVAIAPGQSVTVSSGSRWVVV